MLAELGGQKFSGNRLETVAALVNEDADTLIETDVDERNPHPAIAVFGRDQRGIARSLKQMLRGRFGRQSSNHLEFCTSAGCEPPRKEHVNASGWQIVGLKRNFGGHVAHAEFGEKRFRSIEPWQHLLLLVA